MEVVLEGNSSRMLLKACGLIGCREVLFSALIVTLGLVCSHSVLHHSHVLHALNVLRLPVPRLVAVDT